jgi:integrase/recombinase XerD
MGGNRAVEAAAGPDGRHAGPLEPCLEPFIAYLVSLGFRPATIRNQRSLVRVFAHWLSGQRLSLALAEVDERVVNAFLDTRPPRWRTRGSASTLRWLLTYLRRLGVSGTPVAVADDSPLSQVARRYEEYLRVERGLCVTTVQTYVGYFRQFLTEHGGESRVSVATVSASDVAAFVQQHARAGSPGRAQLMTTALRSMFRFFFHTGELPMDLSVTVPTVPDWRLATIPRALAPEDVERLLAACDRQTPTGRRDHAILLLLARLGLRAGEVIALELEDLHWRTGEITIRGKKGLRHDRFPLPTDVGTALATYLRERRPIETRRVFLSMRAPCRSFRGPGAVTTIVRRALARADLRPPKRGAHLLRHSLATRMLRHGASFVEIGEVLRHQRPSTTEIYAKVDLASLRTVVQPWPDTGGAR